MSHVVGIEMRVDGARLARDTCRIDGGGFAIRVRHANSTGESIHRMDHQITFADPLVSVLLQGIGEPVGPTISAESDLAVTKARNDLILQSSRPILLDEQPLASLYRPSSRHTADPLDAALLVAAI